MTKQEQIKQVLSRTVVEVIQKNNLEKKLAGKKPLRVKLGIDPTSANIHLGRAVVLWKLREFQDLGHKVVFIIGDFTGQIGDTSDKESERPMLAEATIKNNLKTYLDQAFKIIDKKKTEVHYNSTWLKKLSLGEVGFLADMFGLHEFSARENISKRLKAGKRVSLRELLYPLMQGYDSVMVKADVELGGTDQKFNLLAGRPIQEGYKQTPQDVLMVELLEGTDGRKMSSSWGNTINIFDKPEDMFGKVMTIQDELIEKYFVFTTRLSETEIKSIIKQNKNPRDQKLVLATAVVALYHGQKLAEAAREKFISQFSKKELPDEIKEIKVKPGNYLLVDLLVLTKLVESKSEAKRLLQQNGVKINQGVPKSDSIEIGQKNNLILQVGKRKFIKIK
jgi:tyrosyl-tRNA synthetase